MSSGLFVYRLSDQRYLKLPYNHGRLLYRIVIGQDYSITQDYIYISTCPLLPIEQGKLPNLRRLSGEEYD